MCIRDRRRGHQQRLAHQLGDRVPGAALGLDGQDVLDVRHPDDAVQAAAVDGKAGQPGCPGRIGHVLRGGLHLQRDDLHPRRHDVLRGQIGEIEGADEQLGGVGLQRALLGGVPGQRHQLLRAARRGQLFGGIQAHPADHVVRGVVEMPDERLEGGAEAALGGGDLLRDHQRMGDGPVLRDQLADHHQHDRGDRGTENHGHRIRHRARQAHRVQRPRQQGGDRRFGQHADDQAGDGDAQLGTGELEGQAAHCLQGAVRAPVTALGGAFEVAALDGRQRELGGDEDTTGQGQEERHAQKEQVGHRVTSVP